MHEMALAENIVGIVDQAARRAGLARVHRVNVRIGELAVVIPDALQAAFVGATAGTLADGATLKIEFESGVAWCKNCVASVTMHDALDACPTCGGYQLTVTGGNSLRVIDIEGDDEPCAPPAAAAPTPSN